MGVIGTGTLDVSRAPHKGLLRGNMAARTENMAEAVRRRFVVLCTTLHGFATCAESYHRLHYYLPAPGSVAALEIEAGAAAVLCYSRILRP